MGSNIGMGDSCRWRLGIAGGVRKWSLTKKQKVYEGRQKGGCPRELIVGRQKGGCPEELIVLRVYDVHRLILALALCCVGLDELVLVLAWMATESVRSCWN